MITELEKSKYDNVRPLFTELAAYNVSISALLEGMNPGRVFVDNADSPQAAFMKTVEGHHLVGDPNNIAFINAINADFQENHYHDEVTVWGDDMMLCVHPDAWRDSLPALLAPREPLTLARRHYVCMALKYDNWRDHLPDSYDVRQIDNDLLDESEFSIPEHILGWINGNWGTRANYTHHGFGFCILHENTIVSWSIADCASDDRCEIGIHTHPDYRRRNLATITAAAAVDYALNNGFVEVGWHCNEDNIGSWKTAEKVGFRHERDYVQHYVLFSSVHHLAEKGRIAFQSGRPQAAVDIYEQLFTISDEYPHTIYHLAARAQAAVGNDEKAIQCLNTAIDRGWSDLAATTSCGDFEGLHNTPAWEAALARMRAVS